MLVIPETESSGGNRGDQSPKTTSTTETRSLGDKIAAKRAGRLETTPFSARGLSLDEAQLKRCADTLEGAPPLYRGLLARCYAGKASPRVAIKTMCLECRGHYREDIRECRSAQCPLWRLRPYQKA